MMMMMIDTPVLDNYMRIMMVMMIDTPVLDNCMMMMMMVMMVIDTIVVLDNCMMMMMMMIISQSYICRLFFNSTERMVVWTEFVFK